MATPSGGSIRQPSVKAKVVLLGEGAVGKTSIVLRYVENKFNDKHVQTLQASFLQKNLNISGQRIQLSIWDTAGQERYHALGPIYYRDSQAAVVVYDVTDEDSFIKARNWIKELRRMLGDNIVVCIVGNKVDLEKKKVVNTKEAEDYAASVGARHFHTSAKQNKGIQEMFLDMSKRLLETQGSGMAQPAVQPQRRPNSIMVQDDSRQPVPRQSGGGCCG